MILTLVTAILGGLAWLNSRINSRIDQAVTERVEPYEHFLLGMGAVNDEEYDRAIPDFDKAFDALEKRGGPKEELVPLIDYYLYAIVNSEHPAKHSSQFNKIKQTIDNHSISPDAYCFHQIGWYYLRTGEMEKAREQFLRARDKYAEEERYRASADTYWALGMIALADGDVDAAVKMAQEAASKNPTQYALKTLVQDEGAKREDNWYKVLMRLYPKIGSSWPIFFNRLKELSTAQK